METNIEYIVIAFILAIMIFIAPQMVRLKIRSLNWMRLRGLARLHEKCFKPIVITVRSALLVLSVYLILIGLNVV